jgi:hypothetical protein
MERSSKCSFSQVSAILETELLIFNFPILDLIAISHNETILTLIFHYCGKSLLMLFLESFSLSYKKYNSAFVSNRYITYTP